MESKLFCENNHQKKKKKISRGICVENIKTISIKDCNYSVLFIIYFIVKKPNNFLIYCIFKCFLNCFNRKNVKKKKKKETENSS